MIQKICENCNQIFLQVNSLCKTCNSRYWSYMNSLDRMKKDVFVRGLIVGFILTLSIISIIYYRFYKSL